MPLMRRIGGPFRMLARTTAVTARHGVSFKAVLGHVHEYGNGSLWLVTSGMAFFGFVMVTIANAQATKFTGNLGVVGPAYFELLVREFGPLTTALLLAARAAARDASELSSMTVNEQIEALEMSAGDPLRDLVAPRILAGLIAAPLLVIAGTAAASIAAGLAAQYVYRTDGWLFLDPRYVDLGDVSSGLSKAILCGLYIPMSATWRGLATRGGSSDVGAATTDGVVAAVVGCLIIDLLVAIVFFLLRA